ncbi:cell adhesion molecule CEACAM1-like [Anomaloglossus baeobatrachus]|uniref:cell adhesion molecule CEACAM1-like n=1 Tax=Anomaloglossus baeobatrachus TaxID=238106 RepID=UPI003F504C67
MRRFALTVLLVLTMDVTDGQIRIQPIPQYPVINESVTLSIIGITGHLEAVLWYKGSNKNLSNHILTYAPDISPPLFPGSLYNDRISVSDNGSLHIRDLRTTDEELYIAQIQTVTSAEDINVILTVYEPVTKPVIKSDTSQPFENHPFVLVCNMSHATMVTWTRNGDSISFGSGTTFSTDNKTLNFSSVREDSGEYQCEASNVISKDFSDPYTVTVVYGPDEAQIEGALYVRPGASIILTCSTDSYPSPKYQWKVNGAVLLEKTNKYNISDAAPTDEGQYTCVVRNPVTLRTATASVYVSVTTGSSERRRETIKDSENVKEKQPHQESSYMSLQYKSEDTYSHLKPSEIATISTNQ